MDEYLQHIRTLFERMRQADLKLTKRKCNFLKAHVQYLGHYISGQGLEPIPEKLESPTNACTNRSDRSKEIFGLRRVLSEVHP